MLFARSWPDVSRAARETPIDVDDCTGSCSNLELAQTWLRDCSFSHQECGTGRFHKGFSPLPSRVVYIQNSGHVQLFGTFGKCDECLTLSYCWGQGNKMLTTPSRLEAYQNELPVEDMPATFRDACKVTQALGYRYLWIDALCIIQDDPVDVQREMSRMGCIYQNSEVTIFAAKGSSTDSGLFAIRDGNIIKPCNTIVTLHGRDRTMQKEVAFAFPSFEGPNPLSERGT